MSDKIVISAIIVTYNRINYLKEAINSILSQNYSGFEIIIVDNGSTDNTNKLISGYLKKNKNIKYIQLHKNTGVITGRNIGISNAIGKFIFLFDDDAELDDNNLFKNIITEFKHKNTSCITLGVYNKNKSKYLGVNKLSNGGYYTGLFNGGAVFIKKSVFDDIGYFDDIFFRQCEELDFSLRMIEKKHFIYFNPDYYIIHKIENSNKNFAMINYYDFRNKSLAIEKNIKGIDKFFFDIRNKYVYFIIFLKIFKLDLWFKALYSKVRILKENPGYKKPISKKALQNWYYMMKYNPKENNERNKNISLFEYLIFKIK